MREKTIGVLGGMGPEATAEFFLRIIRATPAKKDQDHLRTIIDSNPKIEDRTEAILKNGPDPLPKLIKTAVNLQKAGADFIVIPCNTAHYYYDDIRRNVNIPVLNMITLAARTIDRTLKQEVVKRAGLIATTGTVASRLYDKELRRIGVEILTPSTEMQNAIMDAIYKCVKAGNISQGKKSVIRIARQLIKQGARIIICGCTEISLVLEAGDLSVPVVDPLEILAETAVAVSLGKESAR